MPREKYRQRQQYAAWKKRTNRMITEKNPSGRPIPDSAINHMRSNPYPTIVNQTFSQKEDIATDD